MRTHTFGQDAGIGTGLRRLPTAVTQHRGAWGVQGPGCEAIKENNAYETGNPRRSPMLSQDDSLREFPGRGPAVGSEQRPAGSPWRGAGAELQGDRKRERLQGGARRGGTEGQGLCGNLRAWSSVDHTGGQCPPLKGPSGLEGLVSTLDFKNSCSCQAGGTSRPGALGRVVGSLCRMRLDCSSWLWSSF